MGVILNVCVLVAQISTIIPIYLHELVYYLPVLRDG
jgi:hypothetical protein